MRYPIEQRRRAEPITLQRPGFNIAGLRRADLLPLLCQSSPATLSRQLARLRHLGVIKRVLGTYRYYLTRAGRAAIAAGRRLTERYPYFFSLWRAHAREGRNENPPRLAVCRTA
ncbi:MAG TPA: hypothetical protein VNZ53_21735 [Steroidobacteraceae bacterium]|nr:hypothetical protein [Steroidobacteraceae bacterium]